MSEKAEKVEPKQPLAERIETHFWVSCFPFFDTSLFVSHIAAPDSVDQSFPTDLLLFDADGALVNECSLETPVGQVGVVELASLMEPCKLEGGLKHAHLVARSPDGANHMCRIHTRGGAALLGVPQQVDDQHGAFFPLTLSSDRGSLLALVNYSDEAARVRCRFYRGRRTPDSTCEVPAMGARVLSIETEFAEYVETGEGQRVQAYVRLGVTSRSRIGAQLVERTEIREDTGFFTAVS